MRIALVTTELNRGEQIYPGGLASYIYNISVGLLDLGHSVTVFVYGTQNIHFKFKNIDVIECCPMQIIRDGSIWSHIKKKFPISYERVSRSWSIYKKIKKENNILPFDIIHYTNWKATGLFRLRIPSVLRISSYDKLYDNNPNIQHFDKRISKILEKICILRFKYIFGPGKYIATIIENDLNLRNRIEILPSPLTRHSVNKNFIIKNYGKKIIVYAGTLNRSKGVELLFEIIVKILQEDENIIFFISGKPGILNGISIKETLIDLINEFPNNIIWHEDLRKDDLLSVFGQADLVLIPSIIDNFPNTALEAMSQNSIILASSTSSLDTLITNNINGFLLDTRDPNIWVEKIKFILDPKNQENISSAKLSISESMNEYTPKRSINALVNYYEKVIKEY